MPVVLLLARYVSGAPRVALTPAQLRRSIG